MILKNIPQSEVLNLKDMVKYAEGQVVSKTLIQNDGLGITIFAFAKGEGISTHESKGDALVTALDGRGKITVDGKDFILSAGQSKIEAAVFGGRKNTWRLQLAFDVEKIGGTWILKFARASTY